MLIRSEQTKRLIARVTVAVVVTILVVNCLGQIRPTIIDAGEGFDTSRSSHGGRPRSRPRPRYIGVSRLSQRTATSDVGITLWQAPDSENQAAASAPSQPAENRNSATNQTGRDGDPLKTRALTHPDGGTLPSSSSINTIALDDFERTSSGSSFVPGASVRLTVEVPRAGFLYVIDREKYRDDRLGDPYLIFPTKRTNGGENSVAPGRLVEIPSRDDQPPFFVLAVKPGEIGELLTLIVAPKPIPELMALRNEPLKLSREQVYRWERQWGTQSERYEMIGGAGERRTREEKAAAEKGGPPLTAGAPLPQTVFRVSKRAGEPLLINVPLLVAAGRPRANPSEIVVGQTVDEVRAMLGNPSRIATIGAKRIYFYPDMKITFINGRVADVE